MVNSLKKFYSYLNFLSFDVVLGATAGMAFFAHLLGVFLIPEIYLILGLTVWIIYTLDHLMDAKKTKTQPSTPRHIFHFRYGNPIQFALVIAFLLVVFMLIFLPSLRFLIVPGIVLAGVITVSLALFYFFGRRTAFLKEFLIAIFYVLGITLAPFLLKDTQIPTPFFLLAAAYFLIAWINLLILSYLDRDSDQKDGFNSVLNWVTPRKLNTFILFLAILGILLSCYLLISQVSYFHIYTSILLLMLLIHVVYFLDNKKNKETIRKILEASFLLPLLVLLF
ncbi:hypothetical protein ACFSKL_06260 [Belliella marina]|uniref:Prenyltransferase n=1 Tax=Belliella marina TaxID=1644146 RepID=A0ABW4VLH2_9BACT